MDVSLGSQGQLRMILPESIFLLSMVAHGTVKAMSFQSGIYLFSSDVANTVDRYPPRRLKDTSFLPVLCPGDKVFSRFCRFVKNTETTISVLLRDLILQVC